MGSAPPGPRFSLLQTIRLLRDPMGFFQQCHRRYGPIFRAKFLGFPAEVYVTSAEDAERIYALDMGGARAGVVRQQFLEPVVGEHSLLTLDGAAWWRHRRLLSPALHGKAISNYRAEIARITSAELAGWPLGEPFALRDRLRNITLEVILRLVFGIRDTERLLRLRTLLPELIEIGGANTMMMMPPRPRERMLRSRMLRRIPALPSTRFAVLQETVDATLYEEIALRRAEPHAHATDVLSRLVAARDEHGRPMTDQELRDELLTLLEAGHEIAVTALAWAFERLVRNPEVVARLRTEMEAGEEESYLDAVVKEALRARSVVYEAPRLLDAPLRLGGYEVPAGWCAAPLIALIHRDPTVFPQPDEFRPERFLGKDSALANQWWMPFGGGRRYCAGAQLALLEMRVIIQVVLGRLDLTSVDPAPERPKLKHVTLVPARLTLVVAHRRDKAVLLAKNRG